MKKTKYILLFLLISLKLLKTNADVVYKPYTQNGIVFSFEGIGSYEFPVTKYNTVNLWGGLGSVFAIWDLKYPAFGTEIALEFRQYFHQGKFYGFNIGLYSGFAYMRYPHLSKGFGGYRNSIGFVPGIKFTYKIKFNELVIAEPYLSLSTPMHSKNEDDIFNISTERPGIIITFGVRIGLNKVK